MKTTQLAVSKSELKRAKNRKTRREKRKVTIVSKKKKITIKAGYKNKNVSRGTT